MQAIIISDTSCLILLDKIGKLDLLKSVFGKVLTTQLVADEFGGQLPPWIAIQNPSDAKQQIILETSLDKGEASAIALALEQVNPLLIIDEIKGRRLANQLGINITGTLGIIAEAKKRGHISSVLPLVEGIKKTNFRMNENLIIAFLRLTGEDHS